MPIRHIIIYCGILMGAAAFSIDIMLPAFSVMASGFGTPYEKVQLVIPLFIFAMGIGQLAMGALSDRFGRRVVLLFGLSIYCVGSLACVFGTTIDLVLAGRVIQGLGISAAPVISRAIMRDISSGKELARNFALASAIFAACPIIAPLIGVTFMQIASWRVLFVILLVFGLILIAIGVFLLPETSSTKNKQATSFGQITKNVASMFRHPVSRFNLIMSGVIMCLMLLILMSIPAIFESSYGVKGTLFALFFALHGFGIIIGQTMNRWVIGKYTVFLATKIGSFGLVCVCTFMTGVVLLELDSVYLITASLTVFAVFYLVVYSNTSAMVMEHHGNIAGFAAAFFGFYSQVFGALVVMLLAYFIGDNIVFFTSTLSVISSVVLIAFLTFERMTKISQPS